MIKPIDVFEKHNITEDIRVIITDLNSQKIYKTYDISQKEKFLIDDSEILSKPWSYLYKIQVKKDKWIDKVNNQIFIDLEYITKFLMDKSEIEDLKWILTSDLCCIPLYTQKLFLPKILSIINDYIWRDYGAYHKNIDIFTKFILENLKYKHCFITEICVYLKGIVSLKQILKKHNIRLNWHEYIFKKLYNELDYKNIINDLNYLLKEVEKYLNTFMVANVIAGKIYDFIGKREVAVEKYKNAINLDYSNLIYYLGDMYIYTYNIPKKLDIEKQGNIKFIGDKIPESNTTILCSLDINYLRLFGPQIMVMCSQLKKQHVHLHIIGKEDECMNIIKESIDLIKNICGFSKKDSQIPSFSIEDIKDNIKDKKAFFACSRFIHALEIMNKFNRDLYIMDADMMMIDSPYEFFKKSKEHDMVCTTVSGFDYFSSWKKFSIGNIYFKNNDKSKLVLELMRTYILENMYEKTAWTLDQNAISYSIDYCRDNEVKIDIVNAWTLGLPTRQGTIKQQIIS